MSSFKLLVCNLPEAPESEGSDGIKEELQELFKIFGNVVTCTFYRNNYAMVEMDNEENSANALKEINGKLFREKELSVENTKSATGQENIPVIKLAVKNVAASVKPDEIKDLFTKYGMVTECEITDGNGFVKVEATGDIRTAIKEMNGFVLDEMAIKVEPDVTAPPAKTKSPVKNGSNKSGSKGTIIKKTYTNKPSRGRAPFGARSRGRGRMPILRQFYEDEDLTSLSISGQSYDYDDSYYGEMEMDGGDYYPDEMGYMPGGPFRQDPSFFPRGGGRGGPGRVLRTPGGPRGMMHMGHDQPRGGFQGYRGRGMSPARGGGAANAFGRGSMRGSFVSRGMMRGRGVFRGGPNGRGFPPGQYYPPEEEFYEDEMPQDYLNPGNEIAVRIPRYAPYEGARNFSQAPNRGNAPPAFYGGYDEEPMEEEYYGEEYYEGEYYEDEPIVPPPYLGTGGGYRDNMSNQFNNGQSSFPRQQNKRAFAQQPQRQNVERPPKKRPVAPGEAYPPPPLRPSGSFVPPKKKFKGRAPPAGNQNQTRGNPGGGGRAGLGSAGRGGGNKRKNSNNTVNGNSVPIGGGGSMRGGGRGGGGGRPQSMMQAVRPAMNQQMNRAPAPRPPNTGGMPRFGMRPQLQQGRNKPQLNAPGAGGNRMQTPNPVVRSKMIDFTADIDIN